jgi:UDP-N-acetylglucosamine diphosphorylase / glucose-1-phosphate thymidylyltransferase / UDP-N-acetylgalactosamine diphosphorylase / glucosamine-1-phosphate N-acetyltransferase / galactosamine-1-phosphate N-acetyltransferase
MITSRASEIISQILGALQEDYRIQDGVAIHKNAILENNIILKAPVIIGPDCFIASNCYLRGGVFLMAHNSVGPGCELKSSFIFPDSNLAHFNFVGDSILGSNVNFEAGSIIANHFNERENKNISVVIEGNRVDTHAHKFGALIGDNSKIGANAVLSPGTLLSASSVVNRLELINQLK